MKPLKVGKPSLLPLEEGEDLRIDSKVCCKGAHPRTTVERSSIQFPNVFIHFLCICITISKNI